MENVQRHVKPPSPIFINFRQTPDSLQVVTCLPALRVHAGMAREAGITGRGMTAVTANGEEEPEMVSNQSARGVTKARPLLLLTLC